MKQIIISLYLTLQLPALSFAGVSTSGGGYGVVCRNAQNHIQSVQLLDLVEAQKKYGLTLVTSTGDRYQDYVNSVLRTYELQGHADLTPGQIIDHEYTLKNYNLLLNSIIWVQTGRQLKKINDVGSVEKTLSQLPPNCRLEQMAIMDDQSKKITVVKNLWNKMSPLDQAALLQHEMFFFESRNYLLSPDKTSQPIRQSIGMIFSKNNILGAHHGIPEVEKKNIKTLFHNQDLTLPSRYDSTSYFHFDTGKKRNGYPVWRSQFTHLLGRPVLAKTFVDLPTGVNYLDRFPIQSIQFRGWFVEVQPDLESSSKVKLRLYNDKGLPVYDLRQSL